jgi:penicillin-binding protein 2
MIALAGLELNKITIKHQTFCPGYYKLANYSRKFNDWKRVGHGKVDVIEGIAQSCDVFFYDLASKIGIDQIHDSLDLFQFGKNTNIDMPGELGGVLPSREWKKINKDEPWYRGETLITGSGLAVIKPCPLPVIRVSPRYQGSSLLIFFHSLEGKTPPSSPGISIFVFFPN